MGSTPAAKSYRHRQSSQAALLCIMMSTHLQPAAKQVAA